MKASTPIEMIRPPLTLAFTRPVATEPSGNFVRMLSQFFFCSALSKDRIGLPFRSSSFSTRTSIVGADLQLADVDEFVGGDDALGFAADVDDDFVLANFSDGAGDDCALLQLVEGGLREQLLHD